MNVKPDLILDSVAVLALLQYVWSLNTATLLSTCSCCIFIDTLNVFGVWFVMCIFTWGQYSASDIDVTFTHVCLSQCVRMSAQ